MSSKDPWNESLSSSLLLSAKKEMIYHIPIQNFGKPENRHFLEIMEGAPRVIPIENAGDAPRDNPESHSNIFFWTLLLPILWNFWRKWWRLPREILDWTIRMMFAFSKYLLNNFLNKLRNMQQKLYLKIANIGHYSLQELEQSFLDNIEKVKLWIWTTVEYLNESWLEL